jgi:hypothetical protein
LVRDRMTGERGEGGRVEWVLGDGHEHAVTGAEGDVEQLRDPCGRSGGEEDVFRVARKSVPACPSPPTIRFPRSAEERPPHNVTSPQPPTCTHVR